MIWFGRILWHINSCRLFNAKYSLYRASQHGVMDKVLNYRTVVSKFKLQSHYYIYLQTNTLGKGMNPHILLTMA